MANHSDLTFLTNQKGQALLERFKVLTKKHFPTLRVDETANAENSEQVEEEATKFLECRQDGKLESKAYPAETIHAKL